MLRNNTQVVDSAVSVESLIHGRAGVGAGYTYYHQVVLARKGWFAGLTLHLWTRPLA